jgi:fructose-bisphosphate aldolase/2-amino-3,7-dideoxy-D-threo-hept-6-ulosonate synthase
MNLGKKLRMRRFFQKGKAVIVPMDHPLYNGPLKGLEDPIKLVKTISQTEVDGVLISPGTLERVEDVLGNLCVILRMDGTHTRLGSHVEKISMITTVEHAVKMGADMGVLNIFCGADNEDELLQKLGMASVECSEWGLPLMGEMIPNLTLYHHYGKSNGKAITQDDITDGVKLASRVGAEIGADIIKTNYTGTVETFREVINTATAPVVVAGGPKTGDDLEFLTMIKECMEAGAMGICIGRNVWQRENVPGMLDAICAIVHNSVDVADAAKLL